MVTSYEMMFLCLKATKKALKALFTYQNKVISLVAVYYSGLAMLYYWCEKLGLIISPPKQLSEKILADKI